MSDGEWIVFKSKKDRKPKDLTRSTTVQSYPTAPVYSDNTGNYSARRNDRGGGYNYNNDNYRRSDSQPMRRNKRVDSGTFGNVGGSNNSRPGAIGRSTQMTTSGGTLGGRSFNLGDRGDRGDRGDGQGSPSFRDNRSNVMGLHRNLADEIAVEMAAYEKIGASEMLEEGKFVDEILDIKKMRMIAALVCRYKCAITVPEGLESGKLNFEAGGGSRSVRSRGRDGEGNGSGKFDFSRGSKQLDNEGGQQDGGETEQGAIAYATGFSRGVKTYSQPSPSQGGDRGGRRGNKFGEEDCDPNLIIERIDCAKFLGATEDHNSAAETTAGGEEKNTEDDAGEGEVPEENFVRRQARRKAGETDEARIQRRLRGYLNKLTDKNKDDLLKKTVGDEGIQTRDQLEFFITLLFEKASQMEKFLTIYAELMVEIRDATIEKKVVDDKDFKQLVLNCAQALFDTVVMKEWAPAEGLDDDERVNATVLRKSQRRGLSFFLAKLTQQQILSFKVYKMLVNKLLASSGTKDEPQPVVEQHIETLIQFYNAYLALDDDPHSPGKDKEGKKKKKPSVNIYQHLDLTIDNIRSLTERETHPPTLRIKFLLEDLIGDWLSNKGELLRFER